MKLTHKDIEEFKQIYRDEFGEELSDAEADQRARQLLTLYEVIAQILLTARAVEPPTAFPLQPIDESVVPSTLEDTHLPFDSPI